jgi:hypothetical protein
MKRQAKKRLTEMNAKELAAATAEFDEESAADSFGAPPPAAEARLRKARNRGRPRKGAGAKVISVSVEKRLLERSDSLASKLKISRAALVARGLRAVLAASGEEAPRE